MKKILLMATMLATLTACEHYEFTEETTNEVYHETQSSPNSQLCQDESHSFSWSSAFSGQ